MELKERDGKQTRGDVVPIGNGYGNAVQRRSAYATSVCARAAASLRFEGGGERARRGATLVGVSAASGARANETRDEDGAIAARG